MDFDYYMPFLKEKFGHLIEKYHLEFIAPPNEYEAVLANEHVKIRMFIFSREDGMGIFVTDLKNNKGDHLLNMMSKMGKNSREEFKKAEALGLMSHEADDKGVKRIIAGAAFLLEEYGDKILKGDFSEVEG